jgi:tetratricopeptide (TPR) repeat protein
MKIRTKHIILTLFVLYLSIFRISGQTRTDSLESLFADASDYIKILILGELIDEYATISLEKSLEYANQSLEIGLRKNNQRWIADSYNKIGNIYSRVEMFSEALQYYLDEAEIREQLLDTTGMGNSYFNLGLNYFNMGDTIHSLQYYHKSLKLAKLKAIIIR